MYQGFEADPKRTRLARRVALGFAWVMVTAFAVTMFLQTMYQSTVAEVGVGCVLAVLVVGPILGIRHGRNPISDPYPDEQEWEAARAVGHPIAPR